MLNLAPNIVSVLLLIKNVSPSYLMKVLDVELGSQLGLSPASQLSWLGWMTSFVCNLQQKEKFMQCLFFADMFSKNNPIPDLQLADFIASGLSWPYHIPVNLQQQVKKHIF